MASPSSTEVTGYRIERALGNRTWEATQIALDRRVALERLPAASPFDAARWPDHPAVVPLFEVVESHGHTYVATRLIPGARPLDEAPARPARVHEWLGAVERALDAAHAVGIVHGRLSERCVLVDRDGEARISGWGRAPPDAAPAGDRAALAALRQRAGAAPPRRRMPVAAVVVAALVVAAAGVVTVLGHGGRVDSRAPPVTRGTQPIGSALSGGGVHSVDCDGARPSGASSPCTILQAAFDGRPLAAPAAGVIRAWAVRGVHGRVSLQIVHRDGARYRVVNHSPSTAIQGTRVVRAAIHIARGELVGLEVEPDTDIGVRAAGPLARTARFYGPLRDSPRLPTRERRREELLLRVDVEAEG